MANKALTQIARKAATEGIVLLENKEGVLPFKKEGKIALVGSGCFDYQKGGLGSAVVTSEYTVDLVAGIKAKDANVVEESLTKQNKYDVATLNAFAEQSDCAVVMYTRLSSEGGDRGIADFYWNAEEKALLDALDESAFKKVVVILNVGGVVDVASIIKHEKVKAVLLAWQAGMEGGNAICDVLYGDVTPSGKLTDTFAYRYEEYPSAKFFNTSPMFVYYAEDIFVGYRYFETFAKDKVLYPFGYGLSYTDFALENLACEVDGKTVTLTLTVRNTGKTSGKEVVQVYSAAPKSALPKPAVELRAYQKTKLLHAGEAQTLTLSYAVDDMAYFDEAKAAYILEKGEYTIFVGNSVRNLTACGTYTQKTERLVRQTTLKCMGGMPYKINAQGDFEQTLQFDPVEERDPLTVKTAGDESTLLQSTVSANDYKNEQENAEYTLYDVSEGEILLEEFISKMTSSQLIEMAEGQPPAIVRGTAGFGNISKLKIPNPQTADGPAGVRSTVPTICFPCATLLACAWNEETLYEVGEALGTDAWNNGVDVLLAPGLNIHRNPLCGRNFEYYSEDPLVSGKCASAVVRGVQSKGVGATIKHFALNNKEENRYESNSVASERAMREIYLKGFEIAVKEGKPWCLMTSYNIVNGTRASCHDGLIRGVLREEWGYDGLIMTDWREHGHLWREIKAGSNVRMPYGYPEEVQLAKDYYSWNLITRKELEENARYILKTVMKTRRFKERNFGITQSVDDFKPLNFVCVSTSWSGCKKEADGMVSLCGVGLDRRGNASFVDYRIENGKAGKFVLCLNAACRHEGQRVEWLLNGKTLTEVDCVAEEYGLEKFYTFQSELFYMPAGVHELRFYVRGAQAMDSIHVKEARFIRQ